MSIYILTILFAVVVWLVLRRTCRYGTTPLRMEFFYLFIIASFRDKEIGTDYQNYLTVFYGIKTYGMESGYILLNNLVTLFTNEYFGIAMAVNFLFLFPVYKYITKNVDTKYWGICSLIFVMNPYMFLQSTFNGMRQACATGIVLLGMNFLLQDKRTFKERVIYVIFVLAAAQLHRVAYFMLLVPIILEINWNKWKWEILIVISFLGNIYMHDILSCVLKLFPVFDPRYANFPAAALNSPIYILFIFLVLLYFLVYYEDFASLGNRKKGIMNIYFFSLCLLIPCLANSVLYRVYIMMAICAIPGAAVIIEGIGESKHNLPIKDKEKFVEGFYGIYYLSFFIAYMILLMLRSNASYVPFKFCFN